MSNIQRIVVGTDFSPGSNLAVRCAARLATRVSAALNVVHVYQSARTSALATVPAALWPALDAAQIERHAMDQLAKLAREVLREVPHECLAVSHASAAIGLSEQAEQLAADLLVVGSKGKSGLERLRLGSVAEQVVRHASCAVLAVREGGDAPRFPSRLVVCSDLSPASEAALDLAATLARQLDADVTLLNAQDRSLWRQSEASADDRTLAAVEAELRERLERAGGERFDPPARVDLVMRDSVPRGIVARAEELDADLLVLATHGRTGLERLLIGSVAERVLRDAHCSVLIARSRRESFITNLVI